MATGDISSVTIRADGWSADVKILGFTTGETFSFGDGILGTAKGVLTVTTTGYDSLKNSVAKTRTIYMAHVVRKAQPNQANNDETVSGSDIIVRVALSSRIRSTDTVTATVAAGCFINSGGAAQTSNAVTGLSCTISSTLTHPVVMAQWAQRPFDRWTSNPTLAVSARHIYGVAAVDIILTDTHSHTVTTACTIQSRKRAASQKWVEEWACTPSLSTLTQGDVLTAKYVCYPTIGDSGAKADSSVPSITDNNNVLGACNYTYFNDKNASASVYAVVASTGNDSTGVSSSTLATAAASPYLTIAKALTVGTANVIYLRSTGTLNILGGTVTKPSSFGYWRKVTTYPGDTIATVQIDGTKAYQCPHLSFENVKVQLAGAGSQWFDGTDGTQYLAFNNCYFDAAAIADNGTVSAFGYRSACCFLTNNTFGDASKWGFGDDFNARVCLWLDGNSMPCAVSVTSCFFGYRWIGNDVTHMGIGTTDHGFTTGPLSDPFFCEYNRLFNYTATTATLKVNTGNSTNFGNVSVVGNIIETGSGSNPNVQIHADSSISTMTMVLIWNNTIVGERLNYCYNSKGTTSFLLNNVSVIGNACSAPGQSAGSPCIKSDTFAGDGGASGNRIGNWATLYGVDCYANAQVRSGGFCQAFPGIGITSATMDVSGEAGSTASICVMNFAEDFSVSAGGVGSGDYTPQVGSALLAALPAGYAPISYDMQGMSINNTGTGSIGALQPQTVPAAGGSTSIVRPIGTSGGQQ